MTSCKEVESWVDCCMPCLPCFSLARGQSTPGRSRPSYFSGCSGSGIIATSSDPTAAQGPPPSIHNNLFENNSAATVVQSFGSIQDNLFQNNAVTGPLLYIDRSSNTSATSFAVAERNLFRNNTGARSSPTTSSVVQIAARALLFNNLAYGNRFDAVLELSADQGSVNTVVAENTFAGKRCGPWLPGNLPSNADTLQGVRRLFRQRRPCGKQYFSNIFARPLHRLPG